MEIQSSGMDGDAEGVAVPREVRVPLVKPMMESIARALGCTEGQAYTVAIGLVLALFAAIMGIPPTLREVGVEGLRGGSNRPVPMTNDPSGEKPGEAGGEEHLEMGSSPERGGVAPFPPSEGSGVSESGAKGMPPPSEEGPSELAFADGGNLGELEMLASLGEPGAPEGIVVDGKGGFLVGTNNGGGRGSSGPSRIFSYSAFGLLEGEYTVSGQPSDRDNGLTGLMSNSSDVVHVLDASTGRVLGINMAEGVQKVYARVPDLPSCALGLAAGTSCEPAALGSPTDNPPLPRAGLFDSAGNLYVSDAAQATIWRVAPGGKDVEVFHQSREYISPDGLAGMGFDRDANLVFAVSTSALGATGAVYRLAIAEDGSAGQRNELFRSAPDQKPRGVVLGESGRIYVTLFGGNQLLVLGSDGTEKARVPEGNLMGGESMIDGPAALAFRGSSVLITNQSPEENDPAAWGVIRASVEETRRLPTG